MQPDIERYLMAHSSSIHANYGDRLVPGLKAVIEIIPNPLHDRRAARGLSGSSYGLV